MAADEALDYVKLNGTVTETGPHFPIEILFLKTN